MSDEIKFFSIIAIYYFYQNENIKIHWNYFMHIITRNNKTIENYCLISYLKQTIANILTVD